MGLLGRTSCKEERNWDVKAYFNDKSNSLKLTEQLNEKEATDFYKKLKKELENSKTDFIEVVKDKGANDAPVTWLLNKRNIVRIRLD